MTTTTPTATRQLRCQLWDGGWSCDSPSSTLHEPYDSGSSVGLPDGVSPMTAVTEWANGLVDLGCHEVRVTHTGRGAYWVHWTSGRSIMAALCQLVEWAPPVAGDGD